jgi:hypothetical protein
MSSRILFWSNIRWCKQNKCLERNENQKKVLFTRVWRCRSSTNTLGVHLSVPRIWYILWPTFHTLPQKSSRSTITIGHNHAEEREAFGYYIKCFNKGAVFVKEGSRERIYSLWYMKSLTKIDLDETRIRKHHRASSRTTHLSPLHRKKKINIKIQ